MAHSADNNWHHAGHTFTSEELDWLEARGFKFFTAMDSAGTEGIMGPRGTVEYRDGAWEGYRRIGDRQERHVFGSMAGAIRWASGDSTAS